MSAKDRALAAEVAFQQAQRSRPQKVVRKDIASDIQSLGKLFVLLGEEDSDLERRWVVVDSLVDASRRCRAYINGRGIGSSSWAGGRIRAQLAMLPITGRLAAIARMERLGATVADLGHVAEVSYNGCVWGSGRFDGSPHLKIVDCVR